MGNYIRQQVRTGNTVNNLNRSLYAVHLFVLISLGCCYIPYAYTAYRGVSAHPCAAFRAAPLGAPRPRLSSAAAVTHERPWGAGWRGPSCLRLAGLQAGAGLAASVCPPLRCEWLSACGMTAWDMPGPLLLMKSSFSLTEVAIEHVWWLLHCFSGWFLGLSCFHLPHFLPPHSRAVCKGTEGSAWMPHRPLSSQGWADVDGRGEAGDGIMGMQTRASENCLYWFGKGLWLQQMHHICDMVAVPIV